MPRARSPTRSHAQALGALAERAESVIVASDIGGHRAWVQFACAAGTRLWAPWFAGARPARRRPLLQGAERIARARGWGAGGRHTNRCASRERRSATTINRAE